MTSENILKITEFALIVEGLPDLENPSPAHIESVLKALRVGGPSFVVLSDASERYVQMAGGQRRVIVEHRKIDNETFRYYVFGLPPAVDEGEYINATCGPIKVQKNEVLHRADALEIFLSYLNTYRFPERFTMREVTATFE